MTHKFHFDDSPRRLDHYLHEELPQYSRSRIQSWVKDGRAQVNGKKAKASLVLRGGEEIVLEPAELPPLRATPEDVPLDVLYEDAGVIAINKPAGMIVHMGAGQHTGTLVNALLHRFASLSQLGGDERPGIVHRIDQYTSGVILVARNDGAHRFLSGQFTARNVEKTYLTLVHHVIHHDTGRIEKPITRDPRHRTRMTARLEFGRPALTDFRVLRRFEKYTYLEVRIGTGRTHQIRVHLSTIGHPVAGDLLYGAPPNSPGQPSPERFFLHAHRIRFKSPGTREMVTVEAPLPPDLAKWLETVAEL